MMSGQGAAQGCHRASGGAWRGNAGLFPRMDRRETDRKLGIRYGFGDRPPAPRAGDSVTRRRGGKRMTRRVGMGALITSARPRGDGARGLIVRAICSVVAILL